MSGIKTEATQVKLIVNGVDACVAKETGVLAAGAAGVSGNDVVTMGQSKLTSATAVAASGTSIDFTGIPAWAKRITVTIGTLSSNGASAYQLQLGTSGGLQTTGYVSSSMTVFSTTGLLLVGAPIAAGSNSGVATICLMGSNQWSHGSTMGWHNGSAPAGGGGTVTLSGTLDRIRLTTVNGTDTFDAGTVNIMWE